MAAAPAPEELVKQNNLLDLTSFDPRLERLYNELDDSGENAKYDLRRKIDRHMIPPNNPMFALHALGKVTAAKVTEGQPGFDQSTRAEEVRKWGTGFMISPCHMMTNHHVVCEHELVNGKKQCKSNEHVNGKPVNFSFGENSDGTDFEKRVTGHVIATNKSFDYGRCRFQRHRVRCMKETGGGSWSDASLRESSRQRRSR